MKLLTIDYITFKTIFENMEKLSTQLYDETIDQVNASFELDKLLEELQNNMIKAE